MFVSKKVLPVCLCIGIIFIPFIGSGDLLAKKKSSSIKIAHSPIKYFVPGSRIKVSGKVTDPTGIMLVRCYFKAEGAADFVFVDMTSHSDEYDGILPSPSPNTNSIEYLILAVNNKKVVFKTQSFFIKKSDKKKPAWQNVDSSEQITVKTELPTPPETIAGFSDDIAVDVVESALRFGLVAGGIYAAAGLTAPAGATAGGTVAASGGAAGGISAGTIALGVAGAGAVVGGAVALTSGGDEEEGPKTITGTWEFHLRCIGESTDVILTTIKINQTSGGSFNGSGSGTDYDGTPFTIQISGNYNSSTRYFTAEMQAIFSTHTRIDHFSTTLNSDDTGYIATTCTQNCGCDAEVRLVRIE